MNSVFIGIKKELRLTTGSLLFHLIAVLSPIMFLVLWTVTLKQDITLPTVVEKNSMDTKIISFIKEYKSPGAVLYSRLLDKGKDHSDYSEADMAIMNTLSVDNDLTIDNRGIHGKLNLILKNINANMTKNYRNRLTGAVTGYVEKYYLKNRSITVLENPLYKEDILWQHYFSMTLMALAVFFAGLMFGALSFTSEWTSGGMTALSLSPVFPLWMLGAKLFAGYIKGFCAISVYFVIAMILNPGLKPDYPFLLFNLFLFYTPVFIFGMLIGLVLKEPIISFVVVLILSIILWVFSGGFGTSVILPEWLQNIIKLLPSFYALGLLEYTFFGGFFPEGAILIMIITAIVMSGILYFGYCKIINSGKGIL